jgi:hypothetical protein
VSILRRRGLLLRCYPLSLLLRIMAGKMAAARWRCEPAAGFKSASRGGR